MDSGEESSLLVHDKDRETPFWPHVPHILLYSLQPQSFREYLLEFSCHKLQHYTHLESRKWMLKIFMPWLHIQSVIVQMFSGNFLSAPWVLFHMWLSAHVILQRRNESNLFGKTPWNLTAECKGHRLTTDVRIKAFMKEDGLSATIDRAKN